MITPLTRKRLEALAQRLKEQQGISIDPNQLASLLLEQAAASLVG